MIKPNIQTTIKNLTKSALDLVFPINCVGCGREGEVICESCVDNLRRLEDPYCEICAQPGVEGTCQWCYENPTKLDGIRAPYLFDGPVREAVHRLKYRGWRVAATALGGLMANHLERQRLAGEVLVPVPLHSRRLRSRGYNQSNLLAREIGKRVGLPVHEELLIRTNDSPPQVETRSREDRRNNVLDNFQSPHSVEGRSLILVDDVSTTLHCTSPNTCSSSRWWRSFGSRQSQSCFLFWRQTKTLERFC
ncbi:MAG: amidophosphoribosyltransferase [Dehalococcoidia bacterium]|nr:amidophosphoribosyltransferase [Dehalococcoidia bacterium]